MDGHDLRGAHSAVVAKQDGLVTQDTFLFHDTIFKNIQFGRLDATPEEVNAAARAAFAHDFIIAQPKGYETVVGDKGCLLSGGQQQRLAIARALLKNAPILLLDEATSALDSESEKQIQRALERLSAGRTVIAIAHRLSTILAADQIVVMHEGRIKEIGTHAELMEKSGYYRKFYDLQFHRASRRERRLDKSPRHWWTRWPRSCAAIIARNYSAARNVRTIVSILVPTKLVGRMCGNWITQDRQPPYRFSLGKRPGGLEPKYPHKGNVQSRRLLVIESLAHDTDSCKTWNSSSASAISHELMTWDESIFRKKSDVAILRSSGSGKSDCRCCGVFPVARETTSGKEKIPDAGS